MRSPPFGQHCRVQSTECGSTAWLSAPTRRRWPAAPHRFDSTGAMSACHSEASGEEGRPGGRRRFWPPLKATAFHFRPIPLPCIPKVDRIDSVVGLDARAAPGPHTVQTPVAAMSLTRCKRPAALARYLITRPPVSPSSASSVASAGGSFFVPSSGGGSLPGVARIRLGVGVSVGVGVTDGVPVAV
jgi:hypothetical protein